MRNPLPFDTHAYIKRLVAAGMPEAQAEVQAEALAEFVLSQLATKNDLQQVKTDLQQEGEQRELRLIHRIDSVELRLSAKLESELRKQLVWFFGMLVVLAGGLVALLRMWPPQP